MPPRPAAGDCFLGAGDGLAAGPAEGVGVEGGEAGVAEGGGGGAGVRFSFEAVEGEDRVGD